MAVRQCLDEKLASDAKRPGSGAFEPPSNLLLKRLRPSVWLPTIMVAWGIVMTLMGTVNNYAGLLSTRLFLGIAEAGLFPGVAYFLSGVSMRWSQIPLS